MPVTAFLVEDNRVIRDNLIPTIESLSDARVAGVAETEDDAMAWLISHDGHWEVAVIDLFLREGSGLNVVDRCRHRQSHQRVVILPITRPSKFTGRLSCWVRMRSSTSRRRSKACSIF
ncbi:hypothetical protein [Variovorax sp. EBFNA2]|uniref:hypothetical protein n=1 Tax=Variovorax sp. EBFNA2 TaxID=3342097 RepID=UPI0029C08AB3|nr:hypothetical protein [Variovorax boronicumulans]WPG41629.1 hypothetical protein RZE79_32525 [Variovorax boronicumulans]